MEVKPHVILFLDILGYKNLIGNSLSEKDENEYLTEIHGLMSALSSFIEKRNQQLDQSNKWHLNLSRFRYTIFSDNILFFAPYDSEIDMSNLYSNLIYGLSEFLFQYVKDDIFFRGAITKGLLFYDEQLHFVFGSGLIRAYELESNIAVYPRIIIDDCLKPSPILVGWAQDTDNNWYVDYMTLAYSLLCDDRNGTPLMSQERTLFQIKNQKEAIEVALNKYQSNEYIRSKYIWLANYHNRFCNYINMPDLVVGLP